MIIHLLFLGLHVCLWLMLSLTPAPRSSVGWILEHRRRQLGFPWVKGALKIILTLLLVALDHTGKWYFLFSILYMTHIFLLKKNLGWCRIGQLKGLDGGRLLGVEGRREVEGEGGPSSPLC